jgi:hypothetical protein
LNTGLFLLGFKLDIWFLSSASKNVYYPPSSIMDLKMIPVTFMQEVKSWRWRG